MNSKTTLLKETQTEQLLTVLQSRFELNMSRHADLTWASVYAALLKQPLKLASLYQMESTGGEPDVVQLNEQQQIIYFDCSAESPSGRRSLCYDRAALNSRKANQPENSVCDLVESMEVELLSEEQYHQLQTMITLDRKTSSWVKTPEDIRCQGGALFCDYRFGRCFTYHNGAGSYYAARGFRAYLVIE